MTIEFLKGIETVAGRYEGFLLDLWGVIHDGVEAYPEAAACLKKLRAKGKRIVFVSNAPRQAYKAAEGLARFGVGRELYDAVVTSGEVARTHIAKSTKTLGTRYLILGPERDAGLLEGIAGFTRVHDAKEASMVIVTGFDNDASTIEEKLPYLEEARKANLPLICANPDKEIVRINGVRALCAGVLADAYEAMGGKVIQFGKPFPEVYEEAFKLLAIKDKRAIAMVGDSLITDIAGANGQGIDSFFVAGGILGEALGIKHGELPEPSRLQAVCADYGITPTGVIPAFVW